MPPSFSRLFSAPAASVNGAAAEPAPAERRREKRTVRFETVRHRTGQPAIVDVSSFGCCVRDADAGIGPGQFVGLTFAALGTINGYVRWRDEDNIGVEFCRALTFAEEQALATNEPIESLRRL